MQRQQQLFLKVQPREEATYANFCDVGNEQVLAILREHTRGHRQGCLYLWGEAGSGVSHLLEATCHDGGEAGRTVGFVPLANFQAYDPDILSGMESCEIICLDDVQAIGGNAPWEQALFHLFNRVVEGGGSLILGADRPVRLLPIALPDLRSRFNWGLALRVSGLTESCQARVLKSRAYQRGIVLSDEVLSYITSRSTRRTDKLFEVLDQLDHASLASRRRITVPFVKQVMGW